MTVKQAVLRDHRCERSNMAYKCKISEAVNLTLHVHYTHVYSWTSRLIGIHTESKIYPPKNTEVVVDFKE